MKQDHYQILYEDERGTRYGVFNSTDLDVLGQIYSRMLQFETMFHTFPNASCKLILTRDYNYDPDLGSFRMNDVVDPQWDMFVDCIVKEFRGRIEEPVTPWCNRNHRHESLADDLCDNGD